MFGSLLGFVVPFVIALIVIVFIHEWGHFIVGRLCGVKVEEFSIGFGREIFGRTAKNGTRWKICLLPIGGFVKFEGDVNAASFPDDTPSELRSTTSFPSKPVWQRALIVAAGPLANFILAITIFTAFFMLLGVPSVTSEIGKIVPGGAASAAQLQSGDFIRKINGKLTDSFDDVVYFVRFRPDEDMVLTIDRNGQIFDVVVRSKVETLADNFGGSIRIGRLGIESTPNNTLKKLSFFDAVGKGVSDTWRIIETTLRYLKKIVVGEESSKMIGGPISIAKGAGDAAKLGPAGLVWFIAFISVSIGLINLFPVPMLDGGHLVFYAIEAVRGKPVGPKAQEWGMKIGLSLVLMLMIFGTLNDFIRLGTMFN